MATETSPLEAGLLESGKRLSQSSIWRFQRQFFEQRGVRAWSERVVPTHVTSNAFMAEAYARVVWRFAEDCARQPAGSALALDPDQPLYVVELGAGSGYFAYLFLNKLVELQSRAGTSHRICYVATDFTHSNVEFWANHPCFGPFIEHHLLDLARFDAESDESITLLGAGARLAPGKVANPMVVIGNYVFDTIPHDVFRVRAGTLEEGLASLRSDTTAEAAPANALDQLRLEYTYHPVEAATYDDPVLAAILSEYAATLGDTAFTMPIGGLHCLRNLERLSGGRLLVLAADKGYTALPQMTGLRDPDLVHHGSVSMMVNFHALGRYVEEAWGGFYAATSHRDTALELVAMCSARPESVRETRSELYLAFERFGPLDVYTLTSATLAEPSADGLLAMLRASGWDPFTFMGLAPQLQALAGQLHTGQAHRLRAAMNEVWKLYFPLADGRDLPFEIAFTLYQLQSFAEAAHFYHQSLELHGEHKTTLHNLGLCSYRQGQLEQALRYFGRALALDPAYGPSRDWKLRLEAELLETEPILPQQVDLPPAAPEATAPPAGRSGRRAEPREEERPPSPAEESVNS